MPWCCPTRGPNVADGWPSRDLGFRPSAASGGCPLRAGRYRHGEISQEQYPYQPPQYEPLEERNALPLAQGTAFTGRAACRRAAPLGRPAGDLLADTRPGERREDAEQVRC